MESLRQGIGLRGYAGKNPKQEYKREAFELFESLLNNIQFEVIKFLSLVRIRQEEAADSVEKQRQAEEAKVVRRQVHAQEPVPIPVLGAALPKVPNAPVTRPTKIGRNDPCPCGSGKKFKECHGKLV